MASIKYVFYYFLFIVRLPKFLIRKNKIPIHNKISGNAFISECHLGKYNFIGRNTVLRLTKIGNYCSIAAGVQIGGMEHPYWFGSTSPILFQDIIINEETTVIEDDVWIGANSIVKRGVKIGRGAVIGASSLVLQDVPAYSIVVGTPAKLIKMRFDQKVINEIKISRYWLQKPSKARKKLNSISFPQK